jgi:hypothetical protein
MVSWDDIEAKMVLKIDYSNIPDVIDERAHTYGWDLSEGETFYNNQHIKFPRYNIVLN